MIGMPVSDHNHLRLRRLEAQQFLCAEGGAEEVRLVFAAHDVIVRGSGLESLLADLAGQRVAVGRDRM
jgi:hypothetical protein